MTYSTRAVLADESLRSVRPRFTLSPRLAMHERLPAFVQPFLTWLTAQPAPGEPIAKRSPLRFVVLASLQTVLGAALTVAGLHLWLPLIAIGLLITSSGLGLFQVVVFHHCSHGTVFKRPEAGRRDLNIVVGKLISAVLLFKHFDHYKREHMLHHSSNKLLTEEDEFADFVFNTCGLRAGLPHAELRRRVLLSTISPVFHGRFLVRRVKAAWRSHDRAHNLIGIGSWSALALAAALAGQVWAMVLAWVVPVTWLLQVGTIGRILCEHSFPDPDLIAARGKEFACHATSGVFPGVMPPDAPASSLHGAALWLAWWADMLVVQLLVRVFVLVGDAPCHDYHHRRPARKDWVSYIQARQHDREAGSSLACPTVDYSETWGLFRAIDRSLASLSRLPPGTVL